MQSIGLKKGGEVSVVAAKLKKGPQFLFLLRIDVRRLFVALQRAHFSDIAGRKKQLEPILAEARFGNAD